MYRRYSQGWLKHLDFILIDALVLQGCFVLSFYLRHGSIPYSFASYRFLAIILFVLDILVAAIFNTMRNVLKRGLLVEGKQTLKQVIIVLGLTTIIMYSMKSGDSYSRITLFFTSAFHLILGYDVRLLWKPVVKKLGNTNKKATMILVADESKVAEILSRINNTDLVAYKGIVLINRDATGETIEGIPVVASIDNAADYFCREWIDEVFFYPRHLSDIEDKEDNDVASLIEACRQMAITSHIRLPITDLGERAFTEKVAGYSVITTTSNYASSLQLAVKRTFDIICGLIGSLAAILIIIVVGPIIKIQSPGPILFKQERIGQNGKRFKIYKIRSMRLDADEMKAQLMEQNRVKDGMMFKLDFDPRIIGNKILPDGTQKTGIGEFIRKTSLDEFPQFFNVLKGEMSTIGTRPPTPDEFSKYRYHHRARMAIKPGITGMWQVSGRSNITDFEEVVRLDTDYIMNWSPSLDLKILFKTIKVLFTKNGAM